MNKSCMQFKNNLILIGLVFIMSIFMNMSDSIAAIPDKTLTYCFEVSPTGFDANQSETIPAHTASAASLYNRLIEFGRGGTKLEPGLAESWDISKDGKVYTFHLRRGVQFHSTPWFKPTREFNAEDVLFTFERMRNPNMPFRKAYPTEFTDFHSAGLDKIISKIEALNPYTVRFVLHKALAPFWLNLAAPTSSILSAEYAAKLLKEGHPSEISWKPIGTGPFIFQEYIKDATIRFKGNPEYWKPNDVQLSRLIFDITPDAAVRMQKLRANECQVVTSPRLTDIPAFERDPNFQVLNQPGFNVSFLAYNTTHKPLDDVRIRRALDMAIDKQAIIDQVYEGRAQIAIAPMSPLQWSYDKTLKDTPRDLKQAKALLEQAGYPNGFEIALWTPPQRSYNPNPQLMAAMIQSDWKKIGIKTKIVTYEWAEYIKRANHGEHDALILGIVSSIPEPDLWLGGRAFGTTTRNDYSFSRWSSVLFDDLIDRATQTLDIAERTRLYTQAQKIFKQEQPVTPIAYATDDAVVNKRVTGFKINPLGPTVFSGVGLK
ncbi:ABC-type dipeptide transport system periplasmic component [Candidatus Glomeribacter gigasporarum BEG34]|uniref:ABC-type dipeptide transport system periplasmic component n=2 Tax=Candidatus Glomeribacter gigasporarum TaxID=132144 RepID=G2J7J2_9BURK|nr:ABC-type dipeptide transport system periplasmic component [Candidatus Glomeribacter gigasporarum BEG34]